MAVSNATAAAVIDFPLNIALSLVHIIPITLSSRTISARFTRGRVCGPPPFNYRIALEEETPRCRGISPCERPPQPLRFPRQISAPRPCFTPTDRQFCHDLPVEQARYFSKNTGKFWQSTWEVLAIGQSSIFRPRAPHYGPLQATSLGGSLNAERNRFP